MRKTKLLTILALLLMAVTGAWAQETYTVTVKEGTADAEAVVTGLSGELRTENGEAAAAAWYTLDGRKLDKMPTKKGVYIKNGKKVIIK